VVDVPGDRQASMGESALEPSLVMSSYRFLRLRVFLPDP